MADSRAHIIRSALDYLVHLRRLGIVYVPRPMGETLTAIRSAGPPVAARPGPPPAQAVRPVVTAPARPLTAPPAAAEGLGETIPYQASWPEAQLPADDSLAAVSAEVAACAACPLHKMRRQTVPGEGPGRARLMLIGEGPGSEEDGSGRPFVGPAGQLLMKILGAIGRQREDAFITNTVKCRPPSNRPPEPAEIEACRHYWVRQVALVKPQIIVALGATAAQTVLETRRIISTLRGKFYYINGIYIMPTFHPSALLHNEAYKRPVWEDMKQIRDLITRLETEGAGPP